MDFVKYKTPEMPRWLLTKGGQWTVLELLPMEQGDVGHGKMFSLFSVSVVIISLIWKSELPDVSGAPIRKP